MNSLNIPTYNSEGSRFVDAPTIAKIYGVTARYILQLAAEGRIPCLRMGKKCVRFDPVKVAAAIEQDSSDA